MDIRAITPIELALLEAELATQRKSQRNAMLVLLLPVFLGMFLVYRMKDSKEVYTVGLLLFIGLALTGLFIFFQGIIPKLKKDIAEGMVTTAVFTFTEKLLNNKTRSVVLKFKAGEHHIAQMETSADMANGIPLFQPIEIVFAPHSKTVISFNKK